jgi:hypothetical protein
MRTFGVADGLSDPAPLYIGLFFRQSRLGKAGHEVVDKIIETLETALSPQEQDKQAL